jgi:hypothetical protein
MTIFDEISIIANKLANEGKVPSVALIKGHLSQPTPLPKIIAALKNWHHDPDFIKTTDKNEEANPNIESSRDHKELNKLIAEAIAPLQQEIAELKIQVKALINK